MSREELAKWVEGGKAVMVGSGEKVEDFAAGQTVHFTMDGKSYNVKLSNAKDMPDMRRAVLNYFKKMGDSFAGAQAEVKSMSDQEIKNFWTQLDKRDQ